MANTYTLIASNTLGSSAASVTFSSIPATYTDLVLKFSARANSGGSTAGDVYVRINGSSSTIYSETVLRCYESNTAATLSQNIETSFIYLTQQNGSATTSNTFSNFEVYIPSYTASQNKPISSFGVLENNNTTIPFIGVDAALFRSTSAITSITLNISNDAFASDSSFFLYGIKSS